MKKLDILYLDDFFAAVNKPSGLFVHPSSLGPKRERDSALRRLRRQLNGRVYPVHRLDRPTSGALVFGRSPEAAAALCAAFREREVKKTYLALVRGFVGCEGQIDSPLKGESGTEAKPALTAYRRLKRVSLPFAVGRYPSARYSLVTVFPKTGRMHQIRRHFARIGHPIVGDYRYGDRHHNHFFRDHHRVRRLILMATDLQFQHPFQTERVKIYAPPDPAIDQLWRDWDWLEEKHPHGPEYKQPAREVFLRGK